MATRNEFAPDSYWQAVKDRMGELRAMPGQAVDAARARMAQGGTIMDPMRRPEMQQEGGPAPAPNPLQRQQVIDAMLQQQVGGAAQPVDQRQLILQEAQRRGIPVPPDSPLLQGQGQPPVDPNNPAGIQF